jgi:hypothetical protein
VRRACEAQDFEQFRHGLCQRWEVLWNRHLICWPASHGPQRLQGRGASSEWALLTSTRFATHAVRSPHVNAHAARIPHVNAAHAQHGAKPPRA